MLHRLGLIALTAALVVACSVAAPGGSSGPSSPPSPSPSISPDVLVLRIAYEGGFVAPSQHLISLPTISLYADGSYVVGGAVSAIYPGPLVPALLEGHVSAAGLTRIIEAARAAGLDSGSSYPARGVADVPDTVFTLVLDARTVISSFGALGMSDPSQTPPAELAARTAAADFMGRVSDLPTFLGADVLGPTAPYVPAAIRILVVKGAPAGSDPAITQPPVAWPLATPLSGFGTPTANGDPAQRCGVVSGADATTLWPILTRATSITGFTSGTSVYTLLVRPLLPDESTC